MKKKLKRLLLSERGDSSYISSFVYILVVVILVAFIINVSHIISTKQEMDHIADQLVKQIQLNGGTSGETDSLFAFLSGQLGEVEGLSYQVSGPGNTGRIQIGTPLKAHSLIQRQPSAGGCQTTEEGGYDMMRLYTAIGNYRLNEKGLPLVTAGGRDCALNPHELLLWSSLAFRILTYQELRAEFYEKERELHILGELEFDHYLDRLTMRRLVASGRDCTGVDALYDLLGHLYVQPAPNGIAVRAASFLKLVLGRRLPFRKALAVFHTEKLEPMERQVLALLRHEMLSTAELIQCAEKGKSRIRDSDDLMDTLYREDGSDCEGIVTDCRTSEARFPVIAAVANLYLKQQVTFQIL